MSCRLTCDKGQLHKNESLELICLNEECILSSPLNCIICIEENHSRHEQIHISRFMNLFKRHQYELKESLGEILKSEEDYFSNRQDDNENFDQQLNQLQARLNALFDQARLRVSKIKNENKVLKSDGLPSYFSLQQMINSEHNQTVLKKILSKVKFNRDQQLLELRKDFLQIYDDKDDGVLNLISNIGQLVQGFETIVSERTNFMNNSPSHTSNAFSARLRSADVAKSILIMDPNNESILNSAKSHPRQSSVLSNTNVSFDGIIKSRNLSRLYSNESRKPTIIVEEKKQTPIIMRNYFTKDFCGDGIQVSQNLNVAKLIKEVDRRLVLVQPAIYGTGLTRERTIKFKITNIREYNQRFPVAVGLCILNKVQKSNFIFSGVAEHLSTTREKHQDHGCYMINANGVIRSMIPDDDLKRGSKLRFHTNTEVHITFKPFQQLIVFKRVEQQDKRLEAQVQMKINLEEGIQIFPAIRLADLSDQVEILQ